MVADFSAAGAKGGGAWPKWPNGEYASDSTIELELLVVFSIIKFHHYVYCRKIEVFNNHRSLQYLNLLVKHSSRLARYSIVLQNYDIECKYIKGDLQSRLADSLTRLYD